MKYVSTRGAAPELEFDDALLTGLARDGGLYVPAEWPRMTAGEIEALAGLTYEETAVRIMAPYVDGAIPEDELAEMVREAYATFRHRAVTPLVQTGANDWLLGL